MKKKIILPAAALLAVGVGGLGVAQFAAAEDQTKPNPSATSQPTGAPQGQHPQDRGGKGGGIRGIDTAALAQKLGVDEAKLKTALETLRSALKPTDTSTKPDRSAMETKFAEALAKELGIDVSKVTSALQELRTAQQTTQKADFKSRLDQAVKDGKLTQAEADAVQKAADAGVIGTGGGRGR